MKVLVTGANGFLGRNVVAQLLDNGFDVRVLLRSKTKLKAFPWNNRVDVFEGDLRSHEGLQSAFDGIDVLIHLAVSKGGDEQHQHASNVLGTERLLQAMGKSQTRKIVLVSSISVYDYKKLGNDSKMLTEDSPLEAQIEDRDAYTRSKLKQEHLVRKMSDKFHWDFTILRPAMIWGERTEYPHVLSIPVGCFHFVIGPNKMATLVHVQSCAQAIVETLKRPESHGQSINIIDSSQIKAWDFMGSFLHHTKKSGIRIPVPYSIASKFVKAAYGLRNLFFKTKKIPSVFIPTLFEARFKPLQFSNEKASLLLDWKGDINFNACFQDLNRSSSKGEN